MSLIVDKFINYKILSIHMIEMDEMEIPPRITDEEASERFKQALATQLPLSVLKDAFYRTEMDLTIQILEKHGECDIAELVRNRLKEHVTNKGDE